MSDGIVVCHYKLVILVEINLALLAHLVLFLLAPARLNTIMLVHLRLEYAELVKFGLGRHAKFTVASCTAVKTNPEIRILVDDSGIVAYGSPYVSCAFEQYGAVVYGHHIVGLHAYNIVEVFNGPVVITYHHTQLATVVMGKKVIRFNLYGLVVVGHGTSQIIIVITGQGTINIIVGRIGLKMYGLGQLCVGVFPLLLRKTYHGTHCPCIAVVRVKFKTLVKIFGTAHGVFLLEADLGLK